MTPFDLAKKEIGTTEIVGPKHNPKVVAYFADAGHRWVVDDETAWCAAFVGAMLKRGGMHNTGSLAARSYLQWGKTVPLAEAREGDICIFSRGNSTWQGHVGFYVSHDDFEIRVLGGNQKNAVNISAYPVARLLGVRRASVAPALPSEPAQEPRLPPVRWVGVGAALAALSAALVGCWDQFNKLFGG